MDPMSASLSSEAEAESGLDVIEAAVLEEGRFDPEWIRKEAG